MCYFAERVGAIIKNGFTGCIVRKGCIFAVNDHGETEPLPTVWNAFNSLVLINVGVWILSRISSLTARKFRH